MKNWITNSFESLNPIALSSIPSPSLCREPLSPVLSALNQLLALPQHWLVLFTNWSQVTSPLSSFISLWFPSPLIVELICPHRVPSCSHRVPSSTWSSSASTKAIANEEDGGSYKKFGVSMAIAIDSKHLLIYIEHFHLQGCKWLWWVTYWGWAWRTREIENAHLWHWLQMSLIIIEPLPYRRPERGSSDLIPSPHHVIQPRYLHLRIEVWHIGLCLSRCQAHRCQLTADRMAAPSVVCDVCEGGGAGTVPSMIGGWWVVGAGMSRMEDIHEYQWWCKLGFGTYALPLLSPPHSLPIVWLLGHRLAYCFVI